eukprot:11714666-Ditylum_brightwellii.AAC.1
MVDTEVLFKVEDKSVLGLDYFKDIDTPVKLDVNPPTIGTCTVLQLEVALHSTILLPPWITKELEASEVTTLSKIFLLIQEKAHDQGCLVDAEQDDNNFTPSTTPREDVLHILQSL